MVGESGEMMVHRLAGESAAVVAFCFGLPGPVRVADEAGPTGFGLARSRRHRARATATATPPPPPPPRHRATARATAPPPPLPRHHRAPKHPTLLELGDLLVGVAAYL